MVPKTPQDENDYRQPRKVGSSYFETSDMGLAATLTASGFILARVNKDNPRRVVFLFANTPQLQQQVTRFWSGELKLSATVLLEHIRIIKARIYGEPNARPTNNKNEDGYDNGKLTSGSSTPK